MRCPFCHNYDLVLNPGIFPLEDEENIFTFLQKRKGILTGVAITGGEPTLQPDLADFIIKLQNMGYRVKLDTNGSNPQVLEHLLKENLLDYVAMDIKAGHENYAKAIGLPAFSTDKIDKCLQLLSDYPIEYELRTTAVKGLHTDSDFSDIASWLPDDCNYFIQNYKDTEGINNPGFCSFSTEELNSFVSILTRRLKNVSLRGAD